MRVQRTTQGVPIFTPENEEDRATIKGMGVLQGSKYIRLPHGSSQRKYRQPNNRKVTGGRMNSIQTTELFIKTRSIVFPDGSSRSTLTPYTPPRYKRIIHTKIAN